MSDPSIQTTRKLIELRNLLDRISQISWSFSVLNKKHPIGEVSDTDATQLIEAYEDLLNGTSEVLKSWKN